ncbi:MAG: MerR family transcriptional regulator [Propionibacteriales bacterium]|nr:MerR family transcriptional regulator [Propionibacteriales bacterium]
MFSIGDFARHGRVSVRMLRYYDAMGLLQPAHVDTVTGYRSYEAAQFSQLNRIIALKGLGFTLREVLSILDEKVGAEELRGMLTLRKAQLHQQLADDAARLAQVEARLRLIEQESAMPSEEVLIKPVPAVRVAELNAVAASFEPESIGPVIQPLYDELRVHLRRAGLTPTGPDVAWYEPTDDGVVVHAGVPVNAEPDTSAGFAIVDLPAIEQAATIVHRGPMDDVMSTLQALAYWIDAHGYRSVGFNRELYLDYGCGEDSSAWTTELQEPVPAS